VPRRRKTLIPNRGGWSSLSLFRQIHLGEGQLWFQTRLVLWACHTDSRFRRGICLYPHVKSDPGWMPGWNIQCSTSKTAATASCCGARTGHSEAHQTLWPSTTSEPLPIATAALRLGYLAKGYGKENPDRKPEQSLVTREGGLVAYVASHPANSLRLHSPVCTSR